MIVQNSAGRKDYVLTMTLYCFSIIMIKFILAGISFSYGTFSIAFINPDPTVVTAMFAPLLAAYVARRYTDRSFEHKDLVAIPPQTEPVDPTQV